MGRNGGYIGYDATPDFGKSFSGVRGLHEVYIFRKRVGLSTFTDDFNRTTLGPNWTEVHLDGSGSVTLDGAAVTVSGSASGDFWVNSDGGSMIYRPFGPGDVHEAIVKVTTTGLEGWSRLLMARASAAANAAFAAAHIAGNTNSITPVWRLNTGATASFNEQGTVAYDASLPLWVRGRYAGGVLQFWTSTDGSSGPWASAGTVTIAGLTMWCLCDSQHGAATTYDDWLQYDY